MLDQLVFDNTGLIHLLFSILALIAGTITLVQKKGTRFHKIMGYIYSVAMLGLLITAFMIYRLFQSFGIFHWLAVVSALTLLAGIIPMWIKRPKSYISLHLNFMYWSVFGLYGAFAAETLTRIPLVVFEDGAPTTIFFNLVGVAVFIVMGLGYYFFYRKKAKWEGIAEGFTQSNASPPK